MRTYIRHQQAGASYFFTVNLANRQDNDLLVRHIHHLRQAIKTVRNKHPFQIDAIVVLPDHIHTIWTMPIDDGDYSMRWRQVKSYFSRGLSKDEYISESRQRKKERGIWQRRYWEHRIRDEVDFHHHVDYIHYNPVKHGLVEQVKDWPHSSFHRFVRDGKLRNDWGSSSGE